VGRARAHGSIGRAGWVHDYHFVAQWFPKIGVFWKGHGTATLLPLDEFFSDFGVYDVKLTLPKDSSWARRAGCSRRRQPDGSETLRFVQEDVHDFAWVASRRILERRTVR